jgi:hypothetical protein
MKNLTKNAAFAALISAIFVILLFTVIYVLIEGRFANHAGNLFPEYEEWFKIRSSVGQKIAYLTSAATAFLIGLSFYFSSWDRLSWPDPGTRLGHLPWETRLIEKLAYRPHMAFSMFIVLATVVTGYLLKDYAIFSNLMAGDTHAFYVDGELGQAIHSGAEINSNLFNAYGLGPSLVYGLFLSFHGQPDYSMMLAMGRIPNWLILGAFLALAYRVSRSESARYYGFLTLILAVIYLALPMGIANTNVVAIHNLTGLRYLPLVFLLLALTIASDNKTGALPVKALLVAAAAVLAVMFPDIGTFCLATLVLFLITEQKLVPATLIQILGYAVLIGLSAILAILITRQVLGFNIAEIYIGQASRFSQSNDGIKLEFDPALLFFVFIALYTFFFFLYQAFRKQLRYPERVALALAGCFIVSLMYYMNRPSNLYFWYFGLLIILPLQLLFSEFIRFPHTAMRILIGAATCVLLVFLAQQYFERFVERPLKRLHFTETTQILGVQVEKKNGDLFNRRMEELQNITGSRRNNLVFTTTPWAAMALDVSDRLPKEIVFKNHNQQALDRTLATIASERPQYLVLEKNWPQAFASEVAELVLVRLVRGLQGKYIAYCAGEYWTLLKLQDLEPTNANETISCTDLIN